MARTLPFQPSPKESVIVIVNVRRLGQLATGQKVDSTFTDVNVTPLTFDIIFPFGSVTVNPTSFVLVPKVFTTIWTGTLL